MDKVPKSLMGLGPQATKRIQLNVVCTTLLSETVMMTFYLYPALVTLVATLQESP